jgi:hypothetical protein
MKTKLRILLLFAISAIIFLTACKKDGSEFHISFTNNITEGTADSSGEFTLTGHISSQALLDQVALTKQGQADAFLIDESTAKSKNEYDFSYLITGITENTTIVIDVYDQNGGKSSALFLIKKY